MIRFKYLLEWPVYRPRTWSIVMCTSFILTLLTANIVSTTSYTYDNGQQQSQIFSGGLITNQLTLRLHNSPYIIDNSVLIEKGGQLVIEPGVELQFKPRVGISIIGSLIANVSVSQS